MNHAFRDALDIVEASLTVAISAVCFGVELGTNKDMDSICRDLLFPAADEYDFLVKAVPIEF